MLGVMAKRKYYRPSVESFRLPVGQSLLRNFSSTGSFNDFTDDTSYTGGQIDEGEESFPPSGGENNWGD